MLLRRILIRILGNDMSNKEFQKMLDLFSELDVLLKKYESSMKTEETANPSPLLIPDEIY